MDREQWRYVFTDKSSGRSNLVRDRYIWIENNLGLWWWKDFWTPNALTNRPIHGKLRRHYTCYCVSKKTNQRNQYQAWIYAAKRFLKIRTVCCCSRRHFEINRTPPIGHMTSWPTSRPRFCGKNNERYFTLVEILGNYFSYCLQWRIQDFPEVGSPTLGGGGNIRFCKICPKTAWNWKNLDPEGGTHPPPRSANGLFGFFEL